MEGNMVVVGKHSTVLLLEVNMELDVRGVPV